jgi:hypothetical protein
MTGEVIKSFLVGLGFDVDDKSLAQFNKSITNATLKVAALYGSIKIATAGIFASIAGVAKGFEEMGYQLRIVAPAMNRWLVMRQAMLTAYAKAGINIGQVVREAILFNYSLAKTKFALEAVYKSVAAKFFPLLTKQLDVFRAKIFANMPKIQAQLMKFIQFMFKAFQATVELGNRLWSILTRVYDFFERLHKSTDGWSTVILGVIAAWKLLNLEFLATPLGALIAGLGALLVLFDDFKVWQEGGKSLFDWAPFIPVIQGITSVFKSLKETLDQIFQVIFDIVGAFIRLFKLDFRGLGESLGWIFDDVVKLVDKATDAIANLFRTVAAVGNWLPSAGNWIADHFGGGGNHAAATAGVGPSARPLLPTGANSQQNVSQQTSIVVNGAADAHSVGKQVAGQQDRVNFDMTRNLKGATQ